VTNVIYVESLDICRRIGQNVKTWFKRKVDHNAHVCFESNLTKVPYKTWWIDSGCMPHVSNMMQRFISTQTINPNEKFVFMGNREKVLVEVVRTYCLIFDTKFYLDLLDTFIVPVFLGISFPCLNLMLLDTLALNVI